MLLSPCGKNRRYDYPEAIIARIHIRNSAMIRLPAIAAIFLLTLSGPLHAETVYVTDELRLKVFKTADTGGESIHTLVSGDKVELLERNGFYAKVRLADGRTGWVSSNYLIAQEPAASRIRAVEAERDKARTRLATLESSLAQREARVSGLESEMAARVADREAEKAELEQLRAENESLNRSLARYSSSVPVSWAAITVLVALLAGLVGGWWWMDRRSRANHGGFRIY